MLAVGDCLAVPLDIGVVRADVVLVANGTRRLYVLGGVLQMDDVVDGAAAHGSPDADRLLRG